MSDGRQFNYIYGVIAFLVMIVVNFALWRLFFAPTNGVFKLFTPMYGLSLAAFFMFSVMIVADIFEYRERENNIGKGLMLTAVSLVIFYAGYYGLFWNVLGKYGVTYFSPQAIVSAGGTGAEIWNARENASLAILYVITALIWVSIIWNTGLKSFPWQNDTKWVRGVSRFFGVATFSVFVYAIFFHPNVTALFVPKQIYAGVLPWWEDAAMTSSSFYHLGWMFAGLFVLMFIEDSMEGFPLDKFSSGEEKRWVSGIVSLVIAVAAGFVILYIIEAILNYYWYEPFMGGNYTDDPRFRHLHVAEISAFFMLALLIIKVYFNNIINLKSSALNYLVRFAGVFVLGMVIYFFYYSDTIGPKYMDRVPGVGSIDDTSLCWTIMSMAIIMVHDKFFNGLPLRRKDG
ncbi:hypothetical protein [Limisalsivibrio acetivorans]|uniref:hypothetical protein n=1 Tax=Limisalsivibrio acetivorans TaxID=1304888 RepID=UPI0003B76E23|nr:hypothetical protein [Limisalsivibrio acetivorans]